MSLIYGSRAEAGASALCGKGTGMDHQRMLYRQLALDFSLAPEAFPLQKNYFVRKRFLEGRRMYKGDGGLLQILSVDSHLVAASTDETMLDWCRERFSDTDGAWICETDKLLPLERELEARGHIIADGHPFFIPDSLIEPEPEFAVRWYDRDTLEVFRGDQRFRNVLGDGDPARPDMLVLAAVLDGKIAGAAGASADSPAAWQIGVDVLPEYRGQGIATMLTAMLAGEIERKDILPFYGTGSSHVLSQRVAVKAGFVPGWWELYTKTM